MGGEKAKTLSAPRAFQDFAWSEMEEKSIVERCQVFLRGARTRPKRRRFAVFAKTFLGDGA